MDDKGTVQPHPIDTAIHRHLDRALCGDDPDTTGVDAGNSGRH
ncbi:hypothetical protein [Thermomonospora umbrina]|nr:hypothetical protein [Thermomonospora umbrina]